MNDIIKYYGIISGFPTLLVIIEFFYFINEDKRLLRWGRVTLEFMILVFPFVLLRIYEGEWGLKAGGALFTPAYGFFIYMLIILCQLVYFYCSYRKKIGSPFLEVLINCLLLVGVTLNIVLAIQLASLLSILFICLPAALLFVLMLVHNHRLMIYTLEDVDTDFPEPAPMSRLSSTCLYLLQMRPLGKMLLLITLCLPVIVWLVKILVMSADYSPYNY